MSKRKEAVITKNDWVKLWGRPCDLYLQCCPVCEAWDLWTEVTGETIEYQGIDILSEKENDK